MSDQARFWMWIVALAVTCLFLGAVLSSAIGALRGHNGYHHSVEGTGGSHAGSR
jgi:hypothetical protein